MVISSENSETHRERVRLERRNRRDQRADSGRDSNRRREHVVDQQRGCGQQTRACADVFARDGVRSAAARDTHRWFGDKRSKRW